MTTIYDTDDDGNVVVAFDSRWRFPETLGYSPDDPEYHHLQRMWKTATGRRIPGGERAMGYVMTIHHDSLRLPEGKAEALAEAETYIRWTNSDDRVQPAEHTFNWDEGFIDDLTFLRSLGVRGEICLCGEEGEYERWVLDGENVKMFAGLIT